MVVVLIVGVVLSPEFWSGVSSVGVIVVVPVSIGVIVGNFV